MPWFCEALLRSPYPASRNIRRNQGELRRAKQNEDGQGLGVFRFATEFLGLPVVSLELPASTHQPGPGIANVCLIPVPSIGRLIVEALPSHKRYRPRDHCHGRNATDK